MYVRPFLGAPFHPHFTTGWGGAPCTTDSLYLFKDWGPKPTSLRRFVSCEDRKSQRAGYFQGDEWGYRNTQTPKRGNYLKLWEHPARWWFQPFFWTNILVKLNQGTNNKIKQNHQLDLILKWNSSLFSCLNPDGTAFYLPGFNLHPGKLTWNPKRMVGRWFFPFQVGDFEVPC